eukprot:7172326-Ditylum_brightwellii.AAC.1
MRDTVENISQLKDNDLEEVSFREADLNNANTEEATGHKYVDDSFSGEIFDEDKTVHESQSCANKDKNCTALKKVSLSMHSGSSNHVVDKYGSEVFSISHPIGLPNFENKYCINAVASAIGQMDRKCFGVGNQSISGVGSKKDIVENKPIERELMHADLMNLIKSE